MRKWDFIGREGEFSLSQIENRTKFYKEIKTYWVFRSWKCITFLEIPEKSYFKIFYRAYSSLYGAQTGIPYIEDDLEYTEGPTKVSMMDFIRRRPSSIKSLKIVHIYIKDATKTSLCREDPKLKKYLSQKTQTNQVVKKIIFILEKNPNRISIYRISQKGPIAIWALKMRFN